MRGEQVRSTEWGEVRERREQQVLRLYMQGTYSHRNSRPSWKMSNIFYTIEPNYKAHVPGVMLVWRSTFVPAHVGPLCGPCVDTKWMMVLFLGFDAKPHGVFLGLLAPSVPSMSHFGTRGPRLSLSVCFVCLRVLFTGFRRNDRCRFFPEGGVWVGRYQGYSKPSIFRAIYTRKVTTRWFLVPDDENLY